LWRVAWSCRAALRRRICCCDCVCFWIRLVSFLHIIARNITGTRTLVSLYGITYTTSTRLLDCRAHRLEMGAYNHSSAPLLNAVCTVLGGVSLRQETPTPKPYILWYVFFSRPRCYKGNNATKSSQLSVRMCLAFVLCSAF
jgi:hypothetical protein